MPQKTIRCSGWRPFAFGPGRSSSSNMLCSSQGVRTAASMHSTYSTINQRQERMPRSPEDSPRRMGPLFSRSVNQDFETAGDHLRAGALAGGGQFGGAFVFGAAEIDFVRGWVEGHGFGAEFGFERLDHRELVGRIFVDDGDISLTIGTERQLRCG